MPVLEEADSVPFLMVLSPPKSIFENHVQLSPPKLQIDFHINEKNNDEGATDPKLKCRVNLFGIATDDNGCTDDKVSIEQNGIVAVETIPIVEIPIPEVSQFFTCHKVTIPCLLSKRELRKLCGRAGLKYNNETYDDSAQYEVEEIIEDSIEKGVHWYLVKWKNYPRSEASWEPSKNLHCKNLIQDFLASKRFCLESLTSGRVISATLELFCKKVTRRADCDVPTLVKLCALIGKPVDVKLPVTTPTLQKLKETALTILKFSNVRLEKHREDLAAIFDFYRRRENCVKRLKQWENVINLVDPKVPPIRVANEVDCEGPPKYKFIPDYKYLGVSHLNEPLVGCECTACGSHESTCCPELAGERFPYKDGRLKLLPGYPIYECNTLCKCDKTCANRVVQNGQKVKIEIFRTANRRGWGLRAYERIRKNQFVLEYIGEVITSYEADQRRYGNQHSYLFDLDFENNAWYTVDAKDYGNAAHFINHSCNPNMHVYAVWIDHLDPKLPRLAFFARRDIARGEELTFDYRMSKDTPFQCASPKRGEANASSLSESAEVAAADFPELPTTTSKRLKCKCGASNCRGYLF